VLAFIQNLRKGTDSYCIAEELEVRSAGVCDIQWSINGSDFASACASGMEGLPRGVHQVIVRPAQNASSFQFYGLAGQLALPGPGR
jgi:hypothetical protein